MQNDDLLNTNLQTYPYLKKYIASKIQDLKKSNHPLIECLEKNTPIICNVDEWLQRLDNHRDVARLLNEILKRNNLESFKDALAELQFAAFLSSKNLHFQIIPKNKNHGTPDFCIFIDSLKITIEIKRIADPFDFSPSNTREVRMIDDIRKVHDRIDNSLGRGQFFENTEHILLFEVYPGLGEDEIIDLLYQKKGTFQICDVTRPSSSYKIIVPYSGIFFTPEIQEETKYNRISGIVVHYIGISVTSDPYSGIIQIEKPKFVFYPNPYAKYPISKDIICNLGFEYFEIEQNYT